MGAGQCLLPVTVRAAAPLPPASLAWPCRAPAARLLTPGPCAGRDPLQSKGLVRARGAAQRRPVRWMAPRRRPPAAPAGVEAGARRQPSQHRAMENSVAGSMHSLQGAAYSCRGVGKEQERLALAYNSVGAADRCCRPKGLPPPPPPPPSCPLRHCLACGSSGTLCSTTLEN